MALMNFKGYSRTPRIQNIEESFNKGINFTNAPLLEGAMRELVNFNISTAGDVLMPRPGLRTVSMAYSDTASVTFANTQTILNSRHCAEPNESTPISQVILGGPSSANPITGTSTTLGTAKVLTNPAPVSGNLFENSVYKATDLCEQSESVLFRCTDDVSIHGFPVNSTALARHIGTFAFNNSYYYFTESTTNVNKLCHTKYDTVQKKYVNEAIQKKMLTPKEAVTWGYNMLLEQPYNFVCRVSTVGAVQLLGILPYDDAGDLVTTPRINTTYHFKCFYDAPIGTKYKITWAMKSLIEPNWTTIKTLDNFVFGSAANDNAAPLTVDLSASATNTLIQVTCTSYNGTTLNATPEQVIAVSFSMNPADYGTTANAKPINYNLAHCAGLTYWRNRLVCYSLAEDPTVMIMSDINDPAYFPYPNNVEIFDEPVIYAVPFLDNLLVFTSSRLYLITLGTDGLSWTKRLIQNNLNITEWDIHLIQVVKNMVFFRSGDYYYMIVPKAASTTGDLTIAPISKPITEYLDNFQVNVKQTIKETYGYTDSLTLLNYYNFLDYEDVHNVYVFQTSHQKLLNVVLLYNTVGRYWRMAIYESDSMLCPFRQDATTKGTFVAIGNRGGVVFLQYLQYDAHNAEDAYCPSNALANLVPVLTPASIFKNVQFLDTGYREHSSDFKKRYRELQFKINNIDMQKLEFYTGFLIDGEERRDYNNYKAIHIVDSADPRYGTVVMERALYNASTILSDTVLAASTPSKLGDGTVVYTDYTHWLLDESKFPNTAFWKIRIPVSGKGYAPRVKLLTAGSYRFELLNMSWVYRAMYSR